MAIPVCTVCWRTVKVYIQQNLMSNSPDAAEPFATQNQPNELLSSVELNLVHPCPAPLNTGSAHISLVKPSPPLPNSYTQYSAHFGRIQPSTA